MKIQVIITGEKVHGVGYRVFLLYKALEIGIKRFDARNVITPEGPQVIVRVQGKSSIINTFLANILNTYPEDAIVSRVSDEKFEGHIITISDYMHVIQVEQLTKGIPAILSIDKKQDLMLEKQDSMLDKMDTMIEKQDVMLEKQDSMLDKMDTMIEKQDVMLEKQDSMLDKMDGMETSITSEIHGLRTDLNSSLDNKLAIMREDIIQEIKSKDIILQ